MNILMVINTCTLKIFSVRIRTLKKLTELPEFWIAAVYGKLIDDNSGKPDELLVDILKEIEHKERSC